MSREQAVLMLGYFIGRLGLGYHPDTLMTEYINLNTNQPSFQSVEAAELQMKHNQMLSVLGNDVYDIALELCQSLV